MNFPDIYGETTQPTQEKQGHQDGQATGELLPVPHPHPQWLPRLRLPSLWHMSGSPLFIWPLFPTSLLTAGLAAQHFTDLIHPISKQSFT